MTDMRKLSSFFVLFLLPVTFALAQQAKYVFYFIGDGMGVNQVQGTELYLGELAGKIGIVPVVSPDSLMRRLQPLSRRQTE